MDIRERYAKFVQDEIRENSNPYPTGIQGFVAGVESERKMLYEQLQNTVFFIQKDEYQKIGDEIVVKGRIILELLGWSEETK